MFRLEQLKSRYKEVNVEAINALWAYFYIDFSFFKAAKTGVADVGHLNVRVTALVVMFLGCLETARNPAIGVILDPEVC